jgi:hypothetical protein
LDKGRKERDPLGVEEQHKGVHLLTAHSLRQQGQVILRRPAEERAKRKDKFIVVIIIKVSPIPYSFMLVSK